MEAVTLLVTMLACLLVLILRPIGGLCVFGIVLFGYSQRLTVEVGTLDFSVGRMVVLVLLLRAVSNRELRRAFKWSAVDTWVLIAYFASVYAYSHNVPSRVLLEREAGKLVDTVLPYFAVRLIVYDKTSLVKFIKALVLVGIPLAIMGAIESVTGRNPVGFMQAHARWGLAVAADTLSQKRNGFYRATVTVGNYIAFGLFFAGVAPLLLGLIRDKTWPRGFVLIACGLLLIGLMSSVSSAPLFALVVVIGFLCCFPLRRMWPGVVIALLAGILFIETFSNRHFYHVFTRFALNQTTAYYRIGLIDEALEGGMTGHWWVGYGYVGVGPGSDNTNFDWVHKDLVNIYIGKLARTGLLGLLPFLMLNVLYYWRLFVAARRARDPADLWFIWCITTCLVGWNVAMLTVAALDQINTLMYAVIAIAGNTPLIFSQTAHARSRKFLLVKADREPGWSAASTRECS